MSVALARNESTSYWTFDNLRSGYENIAVLFDGYWHSLEEIYNRVFDVVLVNGTSDNLEALVYLGKSPKWGKLVILEERGLFIPNKKSYAELLLACDFDAFFVHTECANEAYKMFGKPVYNFLIPYPFYKSYRLRKRSKNKLKIGINLTKLNDHTTNFLNAIAIMKYLPDNIYSNVRTCDNFMIDNIKLILKRSGLDDRISVSKGVDWVEFLEEMAACKVHISMDNRHTYGRYDLDAAAVGCISIGTHTQAKSILFPDYIVDAADVQMAAELICKELENPEPYEIPPEKEIMFSHEYIKRDLLSKFDQLFK